MLLLKRKFYQENLPTPSANPPARIVFIYLKQAEFESAKQADSFDGTIHFGYYWADSIITYNSLPWTIWWAFLKVLGKNL